MVKGNDICELLIEKIEYDIGVNNKMVGNVIC